MQIRRVIPVLLIHKGLLYKTKRFKDPRYVGDPTNAVRIFNEKEVDEIAIIDIDATVQGREPNYQLIREIAGEAFMPLAYGGGISKLDQIKKIIDQGVEKIILSHEAIMNSEIVMQTASQLGSSSTVVCLDFKKKFFGGYEVFTKNGNFSSGMDLISLAKKYEEGGAGELIINSIDKDGMMEGYDLSAIKAVTSAVSIPVIALGGAGTIKDLTSAFECGATGAAAGSMFVFHGKHKAVLITYPEPNEIEDLILK